MRGVSRETEMPPALEQQWVVKSCPGVLRDGCQQQQGQRLPQQHSTE